MTTDALWLDGNAAAGLLAEIFGMDMTTSCRTCGSCGEEHAVGAHRLYRGAGYVLRCPACSDLAIRIATLEDRYAVHFTGTWSMAVPRAL